MPLITTVEYPHEINKQKTYLQLASKHTFTLTLVKHQLSWDQLPYNPILHLSNRAPLSPHTIFPVLGTAAYHRTRTDTQDRQHYRYQKYYYFWP